MQPKGGFLCTPGSPSGSATADPVIFGFVNLKKWVCHTVCACSAHVWSVWSICCFNSRFIYCSYYRTNIIIILPVVYLWLSRAHSARDYDSPKEYTSLHIDMQSGDSPITLVLVTSFSTAQTSVTRPEIYENGTAFEIQRFEKVEIDRSHKGQWRI